MTPQEQLARTVLLCRDYVSETVSDNEICNAFRNTVVCCVSNADNASSHSGQTAITTLVSLLSRMGVQVQLRVPDLALLHPQPPFTGSHLEQALLASSESLIVGATVRSEYKRTPDFTFVLGDTQGNKNGLSHYLSGGAWYGDLTCEPTDTRRWADDWPIGAMTSATLAATEVFKFVLRGLRFRDDRDRVYFEPSPRSRWDFGWVSPPTSTFALGEIDWISAGAICQAALFTLTRIPNLEMEGRIFDSDTTDESNLNRNPLSTAGDVGLKKVTVVTMKCGPNIRLTPVPERFTAHTYTRVAPRVTVGVDHIPTRWDVQSLWPSWLAVSGTSHFSILSSAHGVGEPCAGCLHPRDDDAVNPIPTVSFISFWGGLTMAVRLLRQALGNPYPSAQQQLFMTPLRMDQPHAAMWAPVPYRPDCPVPCGKPRAA